ncbi:MAG: hypothetical protein NVS3B20_03170 [Polyangiales bacterium]
MTAQKFAADPARQAELLVADAIGDVIEFWGFRKALGRIWAVLYLQGEPLPAITLSSRLQMSAGAVSMALTELQEWTVVRRVWKPGERREFFEAETDFWKMISKVISERERFLASSVKGRLKQASALLRDAAQSAQSKEVKISQLRIKQLLSFATIAEAIIDAFIASRRADFSLFGNLLQLARPRNARAN